MEITERDIETLFINWFVSNREMIFLGRQVHTIVGVIDVLFKDKNGRIWVVEIKKGKAPPSAITQLMCYVEHLRNFLYRDGARPYKYPIGAIVAEAIDNYNCKYTTIRKGIALYSYSIKDDGHIDFYDSLMPLYNEFDETNTLLLQIKEDINGS